jgi:hypothetical protein
MLTKIKQYFIRILFFLIIVSLGLILTGSSKREYSLLSLDAKLSIGQVNYATNELAEKHLPLISFSSDDNESNIEKVFYEIIDLKEQIVINYYFQWSSEKHPNIFINLADKIWRFVYYRFSVSDLEFIQLNLDKNSGNVVRAKTKNSSVNFENSIPCFSVKSWNHEFSIDKNINCSESSKNIKLSYFDDSDYDRFKMARRSQGDFKTEDKIMNYPFIIFLALLASYYFRHLQKDYNNEYSQV